MLFAVLTHIENKKGKTFGNIQYSNSVNCFEMKYRQRQWKKEGSTGVGKD